MLIQDSNYEPFDWVWLSTKDFHSGAFRSGIKHMPHYIAPFRVAQSLTLKGNSLISEVLKTTTMMVSTVESSKSATRKQWYKHHFPTFVNVNTFNNI